MTKFLLITGLVVGVLMSGLVAVQSWRGRVVAQLETRAFLRATERLQTGNPLEALAIADEQVRSDAKHSWSDLELKALVAARHLPRLVAAYGRTPRRVLADEEGSLLVARAFFAGRQRDDFTKIRNSWRGRETRPELWMALDSDVFSLDGDPRAAEKLLRSKNFTGEAEAIRLVRLALHSADRSLFDAWTLLDQAFALAPRNPEIRSFRAQILESIGKIAEARVEYVAAHVADPGNPLLRDELAEYYRRQGNYDFALQTWREASSPTAPDFIALKLTFWSRVIQPEAKASAVMGASGPLRPLAEFITVLPAGRFWDDNAFQRLSNHERLARERPEVYWLKLLEFLRTGAERDAAEMLRDNPFRARSWSSELEGGLARVLHFRAQGTFGAREVATTSSRTNRHPFLEELAQRSQSEPANRITAPVPPAMVSLLKGPNAYSATLLAVGWREAALALSRPAGGPAEPSWFAFGYAQCLRFNRSNQAALDYLTGQPPAPELGLLTGELLLAEKRPAEGLRALAPLATLDSDAGYRAAWLLTESALETQDLKRARELIQAQPRLSASIPGRELLARITWLGGRRAEAEKMYQALTTESVEALSVLARLAFERKDWTTARQHTEALIRRLPDELQLRENLLAIEQAEKKP